MLLRLLLIAVAATPQSKAAELGVPVALFESADPRLAFMKAPLREANDELGTSSSIGRPIAHAFGSCLLTVVTVASGSLCGDVSTSVAVTTNQLGEIVSVEALGSFSGLTEMDGGENTTFALTDDGLALITLS